MEKYINIPVSGGDHFRFGLEVTMNVGILKMAVAPTDINGTMLNWELGQMSTTTNGQKEYHEINAVLPPTSHRMYIRLKGNGNGEGTIQNMWYEYLGHQDIPESVTLSNDK
ncbi:hypothetical protein GPJ56_009049 [Histomonas meleagridis]|uniref:uncharacterized protein n=1 Tax=Histomonas meleagridis TaxID=135588 RepID=UPI00355A4A54|nr:hypothetical protein GPJ56_009049 [Histomonas meleagridis]KAH0799296.1 hypothetical protein GO595_008093 [Histomonas meleagridis]